jgi:penicillin-binding protein 1A
MEPAGAIRALVGGLDYGESQFNRATNAKRQPGSSFKIYPYVVAIESGMTPKSQVRDSAPAPCGPLGWQPKNYDGGSGSGRNVSLLDAFSRSLNTVASELALYRFGRDSRDKVIEMTKRLGVDGVKKSCSMALGDSGISLVQHTGAYAVFANRGTRTTPFTIIDVLNSKGELVYSRERDEPAPPQIVSLQVVEAMNQMMHAVVTDGTGKRAALEFTHVIGKTGTSSSYRDALFMGMTGALVTGVWLGNDDYRPMIIEPKARTTNATGVTGGGLPAQTWQLFMSSAHKNMNIPTLAGLSPHPTQVAEAQKLADRRRTDPNFGAAQAGQRRLGSIMPDPTRESLKRLAVALRKAAGMPAEVPPSDPARPAQPASPGQPPAPAQPDRRAETPTVIQAAQPSTASRTR